jgi:hypothetical protein
MGAVKYKTYDNVQYNDADKKWAKDCTDALDKLEGNALGKQFLTDLSKTGKKVLIVAPSEGLGNQCDGGPVEHKFVKLRTAWNKKNKTDQAATLKVTWKLKGNDKEDALIFDNLAKQLRFLTAAPTWDPAKKAIKNPFANQQVSELAAKLKAWGTGTDLVDHDEDVRNMILACFADKLEPGQGTASKIMWSTKSTEVGGKKRPVHIGLAHELCHAYYNAKGEQLGIEGSYTSNDGVLYEAMTVGLKPFYDNVKTHKYSENAFRKEFGVDPRTEYNV